MYAYFCLTAEYTVEDGEEIDEVKESDCLYDVSIDAKTDFDYSAARKVKVGMLGDILDDTFEWNTYYEDVPRLSVNIQMFSLTFTMKIQKSSQAHISTLLPDFISIVLRL